jgi:hypothetical protein
MGVSDRSSRPEARVQGEARSTSALNDSGVCTICDIDQHRGLVSSGPMPREVSALWGCPFSSGIVIYQMPWEHRVSTGTASTGSPRERSR